MARNGWDVNRESSVEMRRCMEGLNANITEMQSRIWNITEETGGVKPEIILERLQLDPSDLEREIATLRHMEKVKAQVREGYYYPLVLKDLPENFLIPNFFLDKEKQEL